MKICNFVCFLSSFNFVLVSFGLIAYLVILSDEIPQIPIYARARDLNHLLDLKKAGATDAILENAEVLKKFFPYTDTRKVVLNMFFLQTSLHLGSKLLKGLGVMSDDVAFLSQLIRDSMELQAQEAINQSEYRELDLMKTLQVFPYNDLT